ncbi:hypothetical protein [Treponema vincentii]|uniref:hypothetical protein n=1 Tax=Treponema vincentii TaxID=69710 RepID=UPI0020A27914|nr:hypothetical protein [Treponema vincentii]UTC47697.1 hypothetical protein E4N73_02020 [Treponema vincentii]
MGKNEKLAHKYEQQLAGVTFLKPISQRAKKLVEKIVANQGTYPVSIINEGDKITVREVSEGIPTEQFVLLVKEFTYGKEYYPIKKTYFDHVGNVLNDIELIPSGYSFMVGSKQQERSTSECLLLFEHINQLKNDKKRGGI